MSQAMLLNPTQIEALITEFPNWQLKDGKLYRRLVFEDFIHAFSFMTQVAIIAEKDNHHPEWANIYRTVDVFLTTHDVNGISNKDEIMLRRIEKLIS